MAVESRMEVAFLNGAQHILRRSCPWWLAGVLMFGFARLSSTAQQPDVVDEYEVKAAFIYNFCKFVGWPERSGGASRRSFEIAVVGNEPFAVVLERKLKGKTMGGRPVVIRRVNRLVEAAEAQVAYCRTDHLRSLSSLRRSRLRRNGVLTMGDGSEFVRAGGIISLEIQDQLAFVVNLKASRETGLEIQSNLLGLAKEVVDR